MEKNTQDERKAFIEWSLLNNFDVSEIKTEELGALFVNPSIQSAWMGWISCARAKQEKLEGCVVVPVELSEAIAEKLALEKVEKPRQENDVVWQEIADKAYSENLKIKKLEIKRDYKEFVEAARGGK